jgi:hypothetical protein
MWFSHDRREMRRVFVEAWRKHRGGQPLEPLEQQLVAIVDEHPEYHALLADDGALDRDWTPEHGRTNPFLHLAMHLAIREQVSTDRPPGIHAAWERLRLRAGSGLEAEHVMMEALGEALWQAQRDRRMPDEQAYLAAVRRHAGLPESDA